MTRTSANSGSAPALPRRASSRAMRAVSYSAIACSTCLPCSFTAMGRDGHSRSSSTARVHSATPEVRGASGMMLPVWTEIEDDADAILGNTNRHLQSCEPEYWGFDRTRQPSVPDGNPSIRHLLQAFHPGTDHTFPG